jgi:monoamine oxidase
VTVEADHVIVAVPASRARYIEYAVPLPPLWRAFLAEMELGRNEKWQWAMAATPWRGGLGTGGEAWSADTRGAAALAWEGSVRGTAAEGAPVWTWFFGGGQVGDAVPSSAALADAFNGAAGALDAARVAGFNADRSFWHNDPLTRGAYVNYPPGQLTRFAELLWVEPDGAARAPASSGRVVFAGEHLSDAYPGYMNGAAQTGRLAAEALVGRALV